MASMRATWKSIAFLLIFLAFANNLIASGESESTYLLEEGTTEPIDLATLQNGSYTITEAGTYRFKGTYSGNPTAEIG